MTKEKHIKVSEAIKKIRSSVKGKKPKFSELKLGQISEERKEKA